MYFPDLSPYNRGSKEFETLNTIAIGWLSSNFPFPTKNPTESTLEKLFTYCKIPFLQTRGFHRCEFCEQVDEHPISIETENNKLWLGSAEIRVIGEGKVYASPNLIYHYVGEHNYSPPEEFIESLFSGPQPDSEIFKSLVGMYHARVFEKLF